MNSVDGQVFTAVKKFQFLFLHFISNVWHFRQITPNSAAKLNIVLQMKVTPNSGHDGYFHCIWPNTGAKNNVHIVLKADLVSFQLTVIS